MRHATALLYHVCAVASRNIRFASCGTSGTLFVDALCICVCDYFQVMCESVVDFSAKLYLLTVSLGVFSNQLYKKAWQSDG
jgi:hypothetical protein